MPKCQAKIAKTTSLAKGLVERSPSRRHGEHQGSGNNHLNPIPILIIAIQPNKIEIKVKCFFLIPP